MSQSARPTFAKYSMLLSRFPRVSLAHLPTPLEPLPRLSKHLGGPLLWIKRDDCTGLATGGNKTRKLEFVMADAIEQGADTIVTEGAIQSNHVRQTAAAACKLGLSCEVLLEHRLPNESDTYRQSGNVFLDRLFGARIREYPAETDFAHEMNEVAVEIRANGGLPYIVPGGASNSIGALGYVDCAIELVSQANERSLVIDRVVTATGSIGTHAGLLAGLEVMHTGIPLTGISVGPPRDVQEPAVFDLATETAAKIGAGDCIDRERVSVNDEYVGPGYGLPTEAMNEAVLLMARFEGILCDPVYTGKVLAGIVDLVGKREFAPSDNVVFLHTGGSAALFAYVDSLEL